MADLVYRTIMHDIKEKIVNKEYDGMRLPDERSLSEHYQVSRSSMKRALELLAQEGIVFKKRGSGTFINPLYLKNRGLFKYEGSNLGITDSFSVPGKSQNIELLDYQVIKTDDDLKQDLFLTSSDFVYKIRRLRLLDDQPFLIETGFIPIKIAPDLKNKRVTKSFLTITVEPSTLEDQVKLMLEPNEPVGIIEGIFFLDDGTPFEVSNMRVHYKYMKYNSFVNLNK